MIRKSLTAMALVAAAPLVSAQPVSMCVFDVIGANGDFYNFVKDYALEMNRDWLIQQLEVEAAWARESGYAQGELPEFAPYVDRRVFDSFEELR